MSSHISGGEMELVGAIIRRAIDDFCAVHRSYGFLESYREKYNKRFIYKVNSVRKMRGAVSRTKTILHNYETAKYFIFNPHGLDGFLKVTDLHQIVSISAIRSEALKRAAVQVKIHSIQDLKKIQDAPINRDPLPNTDCDI